MDDLPTGIVVDILSRLPVKTIIHCKCVCKKWRSIIFESYFSDLHFSRSPTVLMVQYLMLGGEVSNVLSWGEVEDNYDLQYEPIMKSDLNLFAPIPYEYMGLVGSVNGLICLSQYDNHKYYNVCVCNPTTREYMILPKQQLSEKTNYVMRACGFGVGLLTGEYKVLRAKDWKFCDISEVYTLGTGKWRSVEHGLESYQLGGGYGVFLNGCLHWTCYRDHKVPGKLITFDIDKETYQLFSGPPIEFEGIEESEVYDRSLSVLKGCLCKCDKYDSVFKFWVMKEYGIEKSWHKEMVIDRFFFPWPLNMIYVVMCLEKGSVLMVDKGIPFGYCPVGKGMVILDDSEEDSEGWYKTLVLRPSFFRLQNLEPERVYMF